MEPSEGSLAVLAESLRVDLEQFVLPESTRDIEPLSDVVGQGRARQAIVFGLSVNAEGYNIAISGPRGSGRSTIVELLLEEAARRGPAILDWAYLHNFADPHRPRVASLPAGRGTDLQRLVRELAEACRVELPRAFESDSYQGQVERALEPLTSTRGELLGGLNEFARHRRFAINPTPMGLVPVPLGEDGHPLESQAFAALDEAVQHEVEQQATEVQEQVALVVREMRRMDGEARSLVHAVDHGVMRFVVGHILEELRASFGEFGLADHFAAIEADIASNIEVYKRFTESMLEEVPAHLVSQATEEREALLRRYGVNLFVNHGEAGGTLRPVVVEKHPSFQALFGRMDFENRFGMMTTDFTRLRSGSVHLANGGYLVVQAEDLLSEPYSWQKLKEALKTKEVGVELPGAGAMPIPVVELVPEAMPLDLKVVLIGEPLSIGLLGALDPDFSRLFKVRAEFEPDTPLNSESVAGYVGFVRKCCEGRGLPPFDRSALEVVIRHGSRLAGRQDRLTARYGVIADLCEEAAAAAEGTRVSGMHVEQAIDARRVRSELIPDRLRQMIAERTLHIDTSGTVVGQVNGLAVFTTGDHAFGTPVRITCRVGLGRRGIVAIERETERSGAVHSKGVLVLSGFLMGTFGRNRHLAFNASLTFEQMYEEVEGDSASSAELYAILGSLAELALRQDMAVTGSVDQFGNIQPVGGVTEKVEGFFDVCVSRGLTGTQGVIVPSANVPSLTLRPDVIDAVRGGLFHLWAVERVEQGLGLLTGVVAGSADEASNETTFYGRVVGALERMQYLSARSEHGDGTGSVEALGGVQGLLRQ